MTGKESANKRNMQKFVRYAEGAKMYSMGLSKFQELAKDAKACYKVGQCVVGGQVVYEISRSHSMEYQYSRTYCRNKDEESQRTFRKN